MRRGRAGHARGRRRRGRSSRWASRLAADGRITSWVGADGGSGARWWTPPSCRGSSGPRSSLSPASPCRGGASGRGKVGVGPPYFETVFVPLMAPALFLMGVGPLARWKKASIPDLAARLRWALAASLAAGLVLPFAMGRWSALAAFGLLLAAWVAASGVVQLCEKIGNAANAPTPSPPLRTPPR